MNNRVITISRAFGSGGREIGQKAAKKLGIKCYDKELIEKISEEGKFDKAYVEEKGEYASRAKWIASTFASRDIYGYSAQDHLWGVEQKVILELAEKESCVIIGRCADFILRDNANCLNVFIHADLKKRAERIQKENSGRGDKLEKMIRDKDKRRAAYYHYYTDKRWGDVQNYHITLDSAVLGIDKCVGILADLF